MGFLGFTGLTGFKKCAGFLAFVRFMGSIGFTGFIELIGFKVQGPALPHPPPWGAALSAMPSSRRPCKLTLNPEP